MTANYINLSLKCALAINWALLEENKPVFTDGGGVFACGYNEGLISNQWHACFLMLHPNDLCCRN